MCVWHMSSHNTVICLSYTFHMPTWPWEAENHSQNKYLHKSKQKQKRKHICLLRFVEWVFLDSILYLCQKMLIADESSWSIVFNHIKVVLVICGTNFQEQFCSWSNQEKNWIKHTPMQTIKSIQKLVVFQDVVFWFKFTLYLGYFCQSIKSVGLYKTSSNAINWLIILVNTITSTVIQEMWVSILQHHCTSMIEVWFIPSSLSTFNGVFVQLY